MNIKEFASRVKFYLDGTLYYVGGFVRDQFLNMQSKDIDCELFHVHPASFVSFLEKNNISYKMDPDGKFPVYRFILDGDDIEVGFPRRDNKTGKGHADFDVEIDPFMSVADASRRRDFTCNAIYQDCLTGAFVDPWGGIEDMKNKILRPVHPDTFVEDSLRFFRAFQFAARFGFDAQPVIDLMKK
jgi:tRNA nucleotidyltransferase (CCA-adding enzyme)